MTLGRLRRTLPRGFTLVELMVTMVVVSMVVAAAYQLFATTSQGMYEVDSLSDTNDRARFALELLARDVQAAGSYGTPHAAEDALVHPTQVTGLNINGIYAYDRTLAERKLAPLQTEYNQATMSDELIVVGAYDFPFSFEVTFPSPNFDQAIAPNSHRGALRFLQLDPFNNELIDAGNYSLPANFVDAIDDDMDSRLLRVIDRNGYMQFAAVQAVNYDDAPTGGLSFALPASGSGMSLLARQGDELWGLEPAGEDDAAYDGALLDAYRYRTCIDRSDPTNMVLVRERLNLQQLAAGNVPPLPQVCDDAAIGPGNAVVSQEPIADYVVDFRVWYDCLPNAGVPMENLTWHTGWMTPDADDADHNCTYIDATGTAIGAGTPDMTRIVHIRLSVRTERERSDLSNFGFLRSDGGVVNATSNGQTADLTAAVPLLGDLAANVVGSLQTFDIDNDPSTAARVSTMQVDVALINFANRERIRLIQDPVDQQGADYYQY